MKNRTIIASILLILGISLSLVFLWQIEFPQGFGAYFKRAYYSQFGPLAISIELFAAAYLSFKGHDNTNLALALFGFTALLDPLLNVLGVITSLVPLFGTIILSICGLWCLWLAFANTFRLKKLSPLMTLLSVVLSIAVELFFNFP